MPEVTWWGHATTVIEVDGVRLLTDPVLRRHVGPLVSPGWCPPALGRVDGILISHRHRDHLDLPSLRGLPDSVPIVVPPGSAPLARRAGATSVIELATGASTRIGGVEVTATPAVHPDGRWGRTDGAGTVGYWVGGSVSIYFAGDTASFAAMTDLSGADLALLPIGGWGPTHGPGHMHPVEAAQALRLLRPSRAVPIHWGSLRIPALWRLNARDFRSGGEQFWVHAHRVAPDVEVTVLARGEGVRLSR